MSACNIDHSVDDVLKKLEQQKSFLPHNLYEHSLQLLNQDPSQQTLNELFHLLKKYDLASSNVKEERNEKLKQLLRISSS